VDQLALLHSLRKFAAETATKADPEKWEQAKRDAVASMGGKHSARAMQQAVRLYKERGGEYKGKKPSSSDNSLKKWTKQEWQTRPGTPEKAERKDGSTSRYLPKEKWESLSKSEQVATDKKKLKSDEQYVSNTRAAKVKSDADYYDKKASLDRLRAALLNHGPVKSASYDEANLNRLKIALYNRHGTKTSDFFSTAFNTAKKFVQNPIVRDFGKGALKGGVVSGPAGALTSGATNAALGATARAARGRMAAIEARNAANTAAYNTAQRTARPVTKTVTRVNTTQAVPGFRPGNAPSNVAARYPNSPTVVRTSRVRVPSTGVAPPRIEQPSWVTRNLAKLDSKGVTRTSDLTDLAGAIL
jgi:hypothetical protein